MQIGLTVWLLMLLQLAVGAKLCLSGNALLMLCAGGLGAAAYLMALPGARQRILGGIVGLVFVPLLASSYGVFIRETTRGISKINVDQFFDFSSPRFMTYLQTAFFTVLIALAAALLLSLFLRKRDGLKCARLCALAAALGYLLVQLVVEAPWRLFTLIPGSLVQRLLINILPIFVQSAALYLTCRGVIALCRMKTTRVRLRGLGLAWAWLAAAGALFTIGSTVAAAASDTSRYAIPGLTRPYTFQLLVGLCGIVGYGLLLCKRRAGLYVILLGTGLLLAAQLLNAFWWINERQSFVPLLLAALLGGLNPLFAWLAVRAGDKKETTAQIQGAVVVNK